MTSPKLQASLDSGIHHELSKLAGDWQGVMKTYFDGVNPINEAEVTGSIKPLFDGRFMQHKYKSSFEGKPLEGIATYAYNMKDKQFEGIWMDTFHTGTSIMFSAGAAEGKYDATGSYSTGGPGTEVWKWRTTIEMADENTLTITAYNIETEGEDQKALEWLYKRA